MHRKRLICCNYWGHLFILFFFWAVEVVDSEWQERTTSDPIRESSSSSSSSLSLSSFSSSLSLLSAPLLLLPPPISTFPLPKPRSWPPSTTSSPTLKRPSKTTLRATTRSSTTPFFAPRRTGCTQILTTRCPFPLGFTSTTCPPNSPTICSGSSKTLTETPPISPLMEVPFTVSLNRFLPSPSPLAVVCLLY